VLVLKVESQKNTYTRAIMSKYLADVIELQSIGNKEYNPIHAHFAEITHQTIVSFWIQELIPINHPKISETH
jgi:hypothetical protein